MAAVMIGVDPHKASHTAVVISAAEEPLGAVRVRACAAQAERLLAWAAPWPERAWAIEVPMASGTCWPSSCWPPVSGCWMCSPSSVSGCGCWRLARRARTTRTTPGRWPSRRCARRRPGRRQLMTTRRCCGSGPSGTGTWAACGPSWCAGCTRCYANCCLAASPGTHRRPGRAAAGVDHPLRRSRGGPPRARRRAHQHPDRPPARHLRGNRAHPPGNIYERLHVSSRTAAVTRAFPNRAA
jgi:hypothetical protein